MSIRFRLLLLVSALVFISATVLVYLTSAYLDTRQRLRESDIVLDEFVQAVGTSAPDPLSTEHRHNRTR